MIEFEDLTVDIADLPIRHNERITREYASMAARASQINTARLVEGSLSLDGLLFQWTTEAISQTEPEALIDALEELEARVYQIRMSVEQQIDELLAEDGDEDDEDGEE